MAGLGPFELLVAVVAVVAGAVASVSGFGIGSLLTPTLALRVDPRLAVAAAAVPHLVGTALRFWMLRGHVDRVVLLRFGGASAAGSLTGAAAAAALRADVLLTMLGVLLVVVGAGELAGWRRHLRFDGPWAWVAGGASGLFGGLVGNQGPLRAAAMLNFDLPKEAFVATATAIALLVDAVRMPIYAVNYGVSLRAVVPHVVIGTLGVVVGTLAGHRVLAAVPERVFRTVVATLLIALGALVLTAS